MTCLILCGGSGTRLWPLSTETRPKQFVPLIDGKCLFEITLKRNTGLCSDFALAVGQDQVDAIRDCLDRAGVVASRILFEPVPRNTAPAIALIAMSLPEGELMLVIPSDHIVSDEAAYKQAVGEAAALAEGGAIVTFGIEPGYPETGYGYIRHEGNRVLAFTEKPDSETAEGFLKSGQFLWNSGMFCFKAGAYLGELRAHAPELFAACENAFRNAANGDSIRPREADMVAIPSLSIDYAVMEKSKNAAVVPCDIGWSDVGSFDSLYAAFAREPDGNAFLTLSGPLSMDSRRNLVVEGAGKPVVLIDVEDVMVVDTEEGLLIAKRGSGQRVKDAVEALRRARA